MWWRAPAAAPRAHIAHTLFKTGGVVTILFCVVGYWEAMNS